MFPRSLSGRTETAALGLPLWAYLAISHGDYSLLFITPLTLGPSLRERNPSQTLRFRDGNELEGLGPGSWFGRPAMLTCRVRFPTTAHVKERWEKQCRGFHSAGVFTVVAPNVPPLHRNLLGVGLRQCDGGETFFSLTVVMLCDMTPPRKLAADRTRRAALAPAALLARRRDSDFARCSYIFLFERQRMPVPRVQRLLLLLHRFRLCQWVLES